jgi:subtilisin family serine protease
MAMEMDTGMDVAMDVERPAWSQQFAPGVLQDLSPIRPLDDISAEWAWGGSNGKGVKVAVIDSGIEASHPAITGGGVGGVQGYVSITSGSGGFVYDTEPHDDAYGHGTACAGIIRSFAPECELYSVRVLGAALSTRGMVFIAGLRWAIDHGMNVCNLSLGTTRREYFAALHELADLASFRNIMIVTAANNMPVPSFPSVYASVISVASHGEDDPDVYYYNPLPPVEFGARGIDVVVPWSGGGWITATGNSFAAPHITGMVTRILAKHPGLTLFQLKVILRALASNMKHDAGDRR